MELKKNLIGHTWRSKRKTILIVEENIKELKEAGADVFEKVEKKPRKTKYKGIKEDNDNSNTESAE